MNEMVQAINFIIGTLLTVCFAYQFFYILIALFKKEKAHGPEKMHRYAILISARNEENVIGHLLESIHAQDYPAELIKVFVAADNCTDRTAQCARAAGAEVFERFNPVRVGKGYALNELIRYIHGAYGEDYFDGYFIFDADNLLEPNYVSEMNRTFSDGYQVVTGYRNSKNYGQNWISSGYALWFLRESQFLNRARMVSGFSCGVSGTGFLFSREVLKRYGGWNFFLLTEDIEFTVNNILDGEKIGYCSKAMLYDEQPVRFSQSWRQRMRWAKGYLQVFKKYGGRLMGRCIAQRDFSCFDFSMCILPLFTLTAIGMLFNGVMMALAALMGREITVALNSLLSSLASSYLTLFGMGLITLISEWKRIRASAWRKCLLLFTFPLFQMTYIPISCCALFVNVEWKPIEHRMSVSMKELNQQSSL